MSGDALDTYLQRLQQFEATGAAGLGSLLAPAVRFRDPFTDCSGIPAFLGVFEDMQEQLAEIRFTVLDRAWCDLSAGRALVHWELDAGLRRLRGRRWEVEGCSLLEFDADGRLLLHADYWDAAALYELLPVVGAGLRWLRGRFAAD